MPPRAVKKSPAGPGMKKAGRVTRATPKSQKKLKTPAIDEESPEVEDVKAEEVKVEEHAMAAKEKLEEEAKVDRAIPAKKEDEVKETVDEYERGERLDLEDNEPEYEPEDYDEKETGHETIHEGDVEEEEPEEGYGEEEEGDMVEEDDVHEDIEGEENDEHEGDEEHAEEEEHNEMNDADSVAEDEEHHEIVKERRKRKEFEIFVGGLDKDSTEDDLRKVFSQVGEVTEVRLMMNPQTKKNKGFAFLQFASLEQAKRACIELKNPVINGKQCGVTPSQDSDTLFIGNVCKTWTKEALIDKLKHYGAQNIEDLTLVEDSNNPGMNRGFAFLEFSSRSDAMDAFKRLQKRDVNFGVDRPAKVSFADSFIDPGDEIMSQVKTVFVDGLLASWDEDKIQELLKQYGKIEKVQLARNMPSARRKDFGFVTFDSHDAAVSCAKFINNEELGEGDNKAKIRARLSRPLQRGKGKHISRGGGGGGGGGGVGSGGDYRYGRGPARSVRGGSWATRPPPRSSVPIRGSRGVGVRGPPPVPMKRHSAAFRDRRPVVGPPPPRSRPVASSSSSFRRSSYERRPPAPPPSFAKSSMKREYGRREEMHPRSRAVPDYVPSRVPLERERRTSYRDEYAPSRGGYIDMPRGTTTRAPPRRGDYVDHHHHGYGGHQQQQPRYERPPPPPPPSYHREGRSSHEYDTVVTGSKRPYSSLDDGPSRYHPETGGGVRHSRARMEYELGSSASQYGDTYGSGGGGGGGDRLGRSSLGYGSSRSSLSGQDSHSHGGMYSSSRQGMSSYSGGGGGGGSYGGSEVGRMYSSGYAGDYISSRGDDVDGSSSYSSLYSSRGAGGGSTSYMGSGGGGSSGAYY